MEKFKEITSDIWREACRHIEITESLPLISGILDRHLPLAQIRIMQINLLNHTVTTAALGFTKGPDRLGDIIKLDAEQSAVLAEWHRDGGIHDRQSRLPDFIKSLIISDQDEDYFITPLRPVKDVLPFLYLTASPGARFEPRHHEMTQRLVEPLSVAMENDSHLRELVSLREAAEADKSTLLAKLSRKSMKDTIVGEQDGLARVMERVYLIAASDVPALIFGETGTGKELIARTIHNHSERREGPFIRVNCGAIPPDLIDSQLFGHERGAFTGAYESRKGWFERADNGTLFLDEVGELPLPAQVRLLRVLQDGWIERVGGKQPIRVNVRIVLATHRDLASMVAMGDFREDLWYRIATFPIYLPPLRERCMDMRALAEHFARRSAVRFGLSLQLPTERDLQLLTAYHWPGNIRELSAVIDRAALIGNGKRLEIALSLGWGDQSAPAVNVAVESKNETGPTGVPAPLDVVIKEHIEQALAYTRGRVEGPNGAAELLDINPNTLRARMRKLKVDWKKYRGQG